MNSTNDKGETYLHFAAFNAEPQLVKWLIEKGADCNLQVLSLPPLPSCICVVKRFTWFAWA